MTKRPRRDVLIKKIEGSTDIYSIGYNKTTKTLGVVFLKGTIYLYPDISWETFREFCDAPSAGTYFHSHIKGKRFERVRPNG